MARKRANGEGTIKQRSDGRWEGQYSIGYTRKSVYGKTQEEVRKKLNKIHNDIDNDLYIEDTKILASEWLKVWLYEHKKLTIKQKTFENYEILVNTHLMPAFPKIKLKELKTNHVQRFINDKIKSGLSDRTVKYIVTLLSCALEQAVKNDMINKNVSKAVTLPKKTAKKEKRILDRQEQEKLLSILENERMGVAIILTLMIGLRRGELLALRWSDFDKEKGHLHIRQNLSRLKGEDGKSHLTFTTPKTKSSNRTITLLPEITAKLNAHKKAQTLEKFKVGQFWEHNDLIFCTEFGKPIEPRNLIRILERLTDTLEIPKINVHALRHTFATRALEQGISLKVVQEILGHSSIAMTADIYSHVSIEYQETEMQKMRAVL